MKQKNTKKSTIIANVIIALAVLGFGYYQFIYSKSPTDNKHIVVESSPPALQESNVINNKKFSYGVYYPGEASLSQFKETSELMAKDFQNNGLLIDIHLLNWQVPEEAKKLHEMDFQFKVFFGAISNEPEKLNHEILFASNECFMRPRLYTSKSKNYQKISDLIGKRIVITDAITLSNTLYDFLVKSNLDNSEIYQTLKPRFVFNSVADVFDGILINTIVNSGQKINSSLITEEELARTYREISFDYPEIPCRGIFASKQLEKKVVDKFSSVILSRENSELSEKHYKRYTRYTPEEFQKIISGFDWEKIDKLKLSTKGLTKEVAEGLRSN